jgi:hypothetical protein
MPSVAMRRFAWPGLLATVALAGALVCGGCASGGARNAGPPTWDYSWEGEVTNLTGCPEGERPLYLFFLPVWEVLRRDDRHLVMVFQMDGPATALLLAFSPRPPATTTGRTELDAFTRDGSLRAWLVRMPAEMFQKHLTAQYNAFLTIDRERLLKIVDGNDAGGEAAVDPLAYPMSGRAQLYSDERHIRLVGVNLRTTQAVPLYTAYAEMMLPLLRQFRGQFQSAAADDSEIRAWERCLSHPEPKAPTTIHGAFRGYWLGRTWGDPL